MQAFDLTPPISFTVGNKSFPPRFRSWAPPDKNTTLASLGSTIVSVVNSSDPLHATKSLAQGLSLHDSKTKALITGQSKIVTFVISVNNSSSSPGGDLKCFVDPTTGQLVGLEQSGAAACSTSGSVVSVPTSTSYISQLKLAYTYDGLFVGRLVFYLKASATAKPVPYTCGSAGGKAVNLLPSDEGYIINRLGIGCAALPAVSGGRRRRLQERALLAGGDGLGLSASTFSVAAAPLATLPVDPATGVPETPSGLGGIVVPEDPLPVPTSTPPPEDAQGPPGPPGKRIG